MQVLARVKPCLARNVFTVDGFALGALEGLRFFCVRLRYGGIYARWGSSQARITLSAPPFVRWCGSFFPPVFYFNCPSPSLVGLMPAPRRPMRARTGACCRTTCNRRFSTWPFVSIFVEISLSKVLYRAGAGAAEVVVAHLERHRPTASAISLP